MSRDTSVILSAVAVALWLCGYALMLAVHRRPALTAGPATEQLRDESPAVVSLLVHDWTPADDMIEATIVDLIDRRLLTLERGIIHLGPQRPTGLTEHEQRVLDRIGALAGRGSVSAGSLTFPPGRFAPLQPDPVAAAALREAREAGLSRYRFDWRTMGWLAGLAIVAAAVVGGSIRWASGSDFAYLAAFGVLVALLSLVAAGQRVQHSPKGIEAAQHWLGVRAYLETTDRHAAYGAALGVNHNASVTLGLPAGRDVLWSDRGGRWRRVRVSYPGGWDRYGRATVDLLRQAGLRAVVGAALLFFHDRVDIGEWTDPAGKLALVVGAYLVGRGLYLAARALVDMIVVREVDGLTLAVHKWRRGGRNLYIWNTPSVDYLVIDDGKSDRVSAWALPVGAPMPQPGQPVRVKVRLWTKLIVDIGLSVVDDRRRVSEYSQSIRGGPDTDV